MAFFFVSKKKTWHDNVSLSSFVVVFCSEKGNDNLLPSYFFLVVLRFNLVVLGFRAQ